MPQRTSRGAYATSHVRFCAEEQGYTLVELLVAMVLLATILAPAGAFLGRQALSPPGEGEARALRLGERLLEESLAATAPGELSEEVKEKGLVARRSVSSSGPIRAFEVRVFRGKREVICLRTARYHP